MSCKNDLDFLGIPNVDLSQWRDYETETTTNSASTENPLKIFDERLERIEKLVENNVNLLNVIGKYFERTLFYDDDDDDVDFSKEFANFTTFKARF